MLFHLFINTLLLATALAYPKVPGSCATGNPLGGSHKKAASSGELSNLGLILKIGGKIVSPSKVFSVPVGKDLSISLSSSRQTFRGFLMRASQGSTDTRGFLKKALDGNVQVVPLCTSAKVGGIGHNNNSDKSSVNGTLNIPAVMNDLKLEITVVVKNNAQSVWYKSDYSLKAA
jgi:Reeler domain